MSPGPAEVATGKAGDTVAQQDGLPDVIVTARRRAEDAQAVPGSLTVVGGALLDRSYTVNTQELTTLVPSLNYSSANPRNTAFTIRGLGSSVVAVSQSNDGLEPGVGFYVDQVYHARPATAAFDFTDIEQIEVLRGPQGTLFGKNTTAGAINITSRQPTFTPEMNVEISGGDYNFVQAKASASAPLTDTLAFRVSGLVTRRDGTLTNSNTGERYNEIQNEAVKAQLLFKPNDSFQTRLIVDFTNFASNCCTQVFLRVGTSLRAATRQYPALAAGLGYTPASTNPYDRVTNIDAPIGVNTAEGGVSTITDLNLGAVTVTNVAAWRFWDWDAANDRDYTGIPIQLTQHIPSRQDQFSEELRVASNGDQRLNYVGGFYFFRQLITGNPISIYGPAATYWLLGSTSPNTAGQPVANPTYPANLLDGYGTDGRTRFTTNSYALFGEANVKIVPRLTLTGGLRYTREDKSGFYSTEVFGGLPTTNTALVNAKLSIIRPQTYAAQSSEDNVSGRANLSYQVTPGILAYASYARGFKSGGINMSGLPVNAQNQPVLTTAVVNPERNTNYEAGLKTRLFDRRLIFNIDGFYTKVRDFQATIVDNSQTVALRGYLANIPRVSVRGVEIDSTALVLPGLSIRANLAYADGRYDDYPAGPCPLEAQTAATTACNLTGGKLASLPRWSETLGADYEHAVGPVTAFIHADSNWRSSYNGDPTLSRYTYVDGYNLTNATAGVRLRNGLEVAAFVRNILDAGYIQNLTVQAGNSGLIVGSPSDPRTYGLTLRAHLR
ncbi:TonB-dependent receptor [Sphingomonas bacterium]|uniref:TonB-dependent receptor n=1 Tax=Sphingomonas bacterium TaxID=1895847 RepID=UPI0015759FA6|nr:TonB-dependent receptor [Sphingomonas bacterium]